MRQVQQIAGVPDAIVSHTKGHADVVDKIQRYKIYTAKMQGDLKDYILGTLVLVVLENRVSGTRHEY